MVSQISEPSTECDRSQEETFPFMGEKKMNQALAIKKIQKNRNQNKASNLVVATHLNHQCEKHAQVKLDYFFQGRVKTQKNV